VADSIIWDREKALAVVAGVAALAAVMNPVVLVSGPAVTVSP